MQQGDTVGHKAPQMANTDATCSERDGQFSHKAARSGGSAPGLSCVACLEVVAILNFRFAHLSDWPDDRYRSSYRLREDGCNEVMTDVLRFVFLELGRFNKCIWELETVFEKWMYLLRHMHEMTEIPKELDEPLFRRLFFLAEIDNFTAEEYDQYTKSLGNMGDYQNIINTAAEEAEIRGHMRGLEQGREQGRAEGREEGREEGMNMAKKEDAKRLKELGVDVEIIAQATGLSVEEIEEL